VFILLLTLHPHPVGKARQVYRVTVGGHGKVQIRRVELLVNVFIQGILYGFAQSHA
jgi:hypothetical protein